MGRVCSMESKATLPILVRRAGREWQRLPNFAALGKGKIVARSGKKRLVCIPTLPRYLLKGTPESPPCPPSPVIRPPQKKQQQEHCSINVKIRSSTGYLTLPLPIWAYNTAKKVPQQPQPETSFCPTNLPRDTSSSNAYLIFDKLITR